MFPTWSDWDISYTRKGRIRKSARTLLRTVALVGLIVGSVRLGQNLQGRSMMTFLKANIRMAFLAGAGFLQTAASRVN
jgi:hypothetical protein